MPENNINAAHDLIIECRSKVTMTGITDVESYDDESIIAQSGCGEITIHGRNLKISRLSVDSGDMTIEGEINSVAYAEGKSGGSFFSKVFK